MTQPYNPYRTWSAFADWYQSPVENRLSIMPFAQNANTGDWTPAIPGILADPIDSLKRVIASGGRTDTTYDDAGVPVSGRGTLANFDGLNVAGIAPLGTMAIGTAARAIPRGALWAGPTKGKARAGDMPPVGAQMANPDTAAAAPMALSALDKPKGFTAYHGSPHDFDKFDISKIGTGEGAQAYGHGLYFAENEGVARSYRDQLGGRDVRAYGEPVPFRLGGIPEDTLSMELHRTGDIDSAIAALRKAKQQYGFVPPEEFDAVIDRALKMKADNAVESNAIGRMYEVRINADPEQFLDWDKPFREQPQAIQQAVETALAKANKGRVKLTAEDEALLAELGPMTAADMAYDPLANLKGSNLVSSLEERLSRPTAAEAMKELGIPGIRYLDQMSRSAGDGSRNYVLFDDSLVDIMRKYANAPTGAAAPLAISGQGNNDTYDMNALLRAYGLL